MNDVPHDDTPPARPDRPATEGPGGQLMGWFGITAITVYLVVVAALVIHGLVVLWPPERDRPADQVAALQEQVEQLAATLAAGGAPDGGAARLAAPAPADIRRAAATGDRAAPPDDKKCEPFEEKAKFLVWEPCLYPEERLFLIVLLAGALGGLVHTLRSFYWYLGNRELVSSWIGMYVTLPVVGAAMAVIFYLVIRGGFTPADSNFDQTNPFGFAAMAVLVGMFTEQASLRLKEVAETVFTKARTGKDHAGPPSVTEVTPAGQEDLGADRKVTITGSGFKEGATVRFGTRAATNVQVVDDTTIEATVPESTEAGAVTVEVINKGGGRATLPNGFAYG